MPRLSPSPSRGPLVYSLNGYLHYKYLGIILLQTSRALRLLCHHCSTQLSHLYFSSRVHTWLRQSIDPAKPRCSELEEVQRTVTIFLEDGIQVVFVESSCKRQHAVHCLSSVCTTTVHPSLPPAVTCCSCCTPRAAGAGCAFNALPFCTPRKSINLTISSFVLLRSSLIKASRCSRSRMSF